MRGFAGLATAFLVAGVSTVALAKDPQVERGRYLALAADCAACHTAPDGKAYAGGLALDTPFGKIYTANITSDPKTGIGHWKEADFIKALREGRGRHGERLYPAMPYTSYTKITDEDAAALWAYIRTIPPVHNKVVDDQLSFPFDIRAGLIAWQDMFFRPGRFTPDPLKDETYNRGAYLVQALGHCGACHTPRNILGATEKDRRLTGATIEHWYAPDISTDPLSGIADWSVDDLQTFLKTGRSTTNQTAVGPMGEVVHDSLSKLKDSDLHAMAVYLKEEAAPKKPGTAGTVMPLSSAQLQVGADIYGERCQSCHGADGTGAKGVAASLEGNTAIAAPVPDNLIMGILKGFPARDGWQAMPAYASALDDQEIANVANFVRAKLGNHASADVTPWMVGAMRYETDAPAAGTAEPPQFQCPKFADYKLDDATTKALQALGTDFSDPTKLEAVIDAYRKGQPDSSKSTMVEALLTGYCPTIAGMDLPFGAKGARLADFVGRLSAIVAPPKS
ncbi:MAG: c-type cytochrome [Geminicoccaceae bacterium]